LRRNRAVSSTWTAASPITIPIRTVPANLARLIAAVKGKSAPSWASPSTATPTASAPWMKNGAPIYGDQLLIIYAREILSRKPGAKFIGEVKCSQTLYDDIRAHGGSRHHVEDRPLADQGQDERGARRPRRRNERSYVFADRYYGFDDALYAAAGCSKFVANSGSALSALLADVPKTVTTRRDPRRLSDDVKFDVVKRVTEHFRELYPVIDVDGVRVLFPHGGTGPRFQHSAGAGPALRSDHAGAVAPISDGSGNGCGAGPDKKSRPR